MKSIGMLLTSALLAAGVSAQTYPTRPIRFITVAAPGTVGDIIPRVVNKTEVHPTVIWAKFEAMREGARLASQRLWKRKPASKKQRRKS